MFCNQCGKKVDGNSKFCDQCGNLIEDVKAIETIVSFCNQCGTKMVKDQSFCAKCGKSSNDMRIKANVEAESPPRKKKNFKPLIITAGLAMFFIAAVFIGFKLKDNFKTTEAEIPPKEVENHTSKDLQDSIEEIEDIEEEVLLTEEDSLLDQVEKLRESLYLFQSDKIYISEDFLDSLSREEVALVRNEIFARHGFVFTKEPYTSYFTAMPWYVPDEDFTDSVFSEIEKANVDSIVSYERKMGWN